MKQQASTSHAFVGSRVMKDPKENWVNDLVFACHGRSVAAGWWTNLKTGEQHTDNAELMQLLVPQKLMLIVSEIAEAMEGHRKSKMDDHLPNRPMFEVELADALIRIFDLAGACSCDLGGALVEKLAYNAQRPDHKLEARQADGGKSY